MNTNPPKYSKKEPFLKIYKAQKKHHYIDLFNYYIVKKIFFIFNILPSGIFWKDDL